MPSARPRLSAILARIEKAYGRQQAIEPRDALGLVLYRNAGYPQSDANCARGFAALKTQIGLTPEQLLAAPVAALRKALREGGIVPELRAERVREIARRVRDDFGGDLDVVLTGPLDDAKKILRSFPTVAEAGADKILLFTATAPVAALPSNALQVPLRLGFGREAKSWGASYRSAQAAIAEELPERVSDRTRAYLLLKRLGLEVCKRTRPQCDRCPVSSQCEYFQKLRDRAAQ